MRKNLVLFGEHPDDLKAKDGPRRIWSMNKLLKPNERFLMYESYRKCSAQPQEQALPDLEVTIMDMVSRLYMAKRAARHGTGTGTDRHGPARHGTTRHGMLAVPCLIVPPCRLSGPGTALSWLRRAVPCHWARQPVVLVPALTLKVSNTSETSEF